MNGRQFNHHEVMEKLVPPTRIERATRGLGISDRGIAGRRIKADNPLPSLGGMLIHSLGSVPRYQAAFVCFGMAF